MAMIVQHNLRAMNSNRMLGVNSSTIAKSTEKLSSGYKINRAADDAAGLSISEKMRKQIRGLTQASLNAQDGISCVQTAEGALNEVQDMLQRMNELAVKAANGTNSEDDRSYIQAEVDQLLTEIDRVSTTTKFNETYLLKGDPEKEQTEETIYDNFDISSVTAAMAEGSTFTVKEGKEFDETNGKVTYTFTTGLKEGGTWDGKKINSTNTGADEISLDDAKAEELEEMQAAYDKLVADGKVAAQTLAAGDKEFTSAKSNTYKYNKSVDLSLHVGADAANDNKIAMSIDSISTDALHLKGLKVDGADGSNATAAIDKIAEAIQKISTQRSDLGAVQNRLEHTIANLDNVVENTTAAEAQIRDTDMATEMVKYSNTNILTQAGQAMLAQSNQANQGVLSLLQ